MLPKRLACAAACCALLSPTVVRAEPGPTSAAALPEAEPLLRPGARVRLNAVGPKLRTGRVLSVDDRQLLLEVHPDKDPILVRRADIRTLDVVAGRKRATKKGAIIGGISLAIPGALLGAAAASFCWECTPRPG